MCNFTGKKFLTRLHVLVKRLLAVCVSMVWLNRIKARDAPDFDYFIKHFIERATVLLVSSCWTSYCFMKTTSCQKNGCVIYGCVKRHPLYTVGRQLSRFCFVFPLKLGLPVAAVSAQRAMEHVKNTLKNITTEWTPHSVLCLPSLTTLFLK